MLLVAKTPEVFAVTDLSADVTHNLGSVEQIPVGEGRRFEIGGRGIAVFRSRKGRLFATQAECTHRAGPLADGLIGGDALICPLHNFKFNLETGEPLGNDCPALVTFPVGLNETGEIVVGLRES